MDPILASIIGGVGVGILKSYLDEGNAKKQREMQAAVAQYSPWTGMRPSLQGLQTDYAGNLLSGGLTGAQFGQGLERQAADEAMRADQLKTNRTWRDYLDSKTNDESEAAAAVLPAKPPGAATSMNYSPYSIMARRPYV